MVTYLSPGMIMDPVSGLPEREDWANAKRVDAPRAFVLQAATSTDDADGTARTDKQTWTLYIPEGELEPGRRDRIEFDGTLFAQDGVCVREVNPFTGWAPYAQVRLVAVEGV